MELATDEPRVVRHFDDFDVDAIRRATTDAESRMREDLSCATRLPNLA